MLEVSQEKVARERSISRECRCPAGASNREDRNEIWTVQVLCSATDKVGDVYSPRLRDCTIPIADLPRWLPEISRQMSEVIAGRKRGENGPWRFGDMTRESWK